MEVIRESICFGGAPCGGAPPFFAGGNGPRFLAGQPAPCGKSAHRRPDGPRTEKQLPDTQTRPGPKAGAGLCFVVWRDQYMPPMSGAGAGAGGSGMLTTMASVVSTVAATEAAFSSALRQTLVGSTMPAAIMSTYSSLAASKP